MLFEQREEINSRMKYRKLIKFWTSCKIIRSTSEHRMYAMFMKINSIRLISV